MTPLHTLRQACCHPQLIRSGSYLPASMTNKRWVAVLNTCVCVWETNLLFPYLMELTKYNVSCLGGRGEGCSSRGTCIMIKSWLCVCVFRIIIACSTVEMRVKPEAWKLLSFFEFDSWTCKLIKSFVHSCTVLRTLKAVAVPFKLCVEKYVRRKFNFELVSH